MKEHYKLFRWTGTQENNDRASILLAEADGSAFYTEMRHLAILMYGVNNISQTVEMVPGEAKPEESVEGNGH